MKRGSAMAKQCQTEFANQRKNLLENSLLELLQTRSYMDVTVSDICAAAGIPRRTFYRYFENKEDVLDSIIENIMMCCYLEIMFDVYDEAEKMRNSFSRVFEFWRGSNRKTLGVLMKNGLESRLMTHAMNWVRTEQFGFHMFKEMDPKLLEIGLMAGIAEFFTLLFYWSRNGYQESPDEMAEFAVWVLPRAFYSK